MTHCQWCAKPTDGTKWCSGNACRNAFNTWNRRLFDFVIRVMTDPGALKEWAESQ